MECEEHPQEAIDAGYSSVLPRTKDYNDYWIDMTGVFHCKNFGRFADNYTEFSLKSRCNNVNNFAVFEPPTSWPQCKESEFAHVRNGLLSFLISIMCPLIAATCPALPTPPEGMQIKRIYREGI